MTEEWIKRFAKSRWGMSLILAAILGSVLLCEANRVLGAIALTVVYFESFELLE